MTEPGPAQGPSTAAADHTAYANNHSLTQRDVRHLPSWFVITMSMVAGLSLVLGIVSQVQYQQSVTARTDAIYASNLKSCEQDNHLRQAFTKFFASTTLPAAPVTDPRYGPYLELKDALLPTNCAATVKGSG